MPAGSPEVTAITGGAALLAFFDAVFDIGAVAHLPEPVLIRFFGFALAQHLPRGEPLAFRRGVRGEVIAWLARRRGGGKSI